MRVVTRLEAERPWTVGDPSQRQSAVLNLLLNARDAMPHGGTISVTTTNIEITEDESSSRALGLARGDYVAIGVHDTGVGTDVEMPACIFEPFFTTKETGGRTGRVGRWLRR